MDEQQEQLWHTHEDDRGKGKESGKSSGGVIKRSKLRKFSRRLKLYECIVKSAGIYGVEIWGWAKRKEVAQLQGKYLKMAMGISGNTPDYIWKMEAGRKGLEIESRMRAMRYVK